MLKIPIKFTDGEWQYINGGPIDVRDQSSAILYIHKENIKDKSFVEALTEKRVIRILDADAELFVGIHPTPDLPENLSKNIYHSRAAGFESFIRIKLVRTEKSILLESTENHGLFIILEGHEVKNIDSPAIQIIDIPEEYSDKKYARSLNHAYTIISEIFEPHRISHTGNIYKNIFYNEPKINQLFPLGDLRDKKIARGGRDILKTLWDKIQIELESIHKN